MKKKVDILHAYLETVSKYINGQMLLSTVDGNVCLKFSCDFMEGTQR